MTVDRRLLDFATEKQKAVIEALIAHGTHQKAADALGCAKSLIGQQLSGVKRRAETRGYSPEHDMTRTVPEGYGIKGTSTLYNAKGEISAQWVKTKRDDQLAEQYMRAFVEDLVENGARGASSVIPTPSDTDADLLTAYLYGDPHFGMRAMRAESGDDFDLAEAERLMCSSIDYMVARSPASETGLLVEIGDFFHADDSSNATPQSKNPLDVDGRFFDITQVGLRTTVYTINRMKAKHAKVIVWIMPGNHDPHTSWMLALCLASFFTNDPRVEIDLTPGLYKYLRFGKNLFGAHHGHGAKIGELGLIMANDRPQDWGLTEHRIFWMGHIHHKQAVELPGVTAESLNTLAPGDAWHRGQGYRSSRSTQMAVFHAQHGETERHKCNVSRLVKSAA